MTGWLRQPNIRLNPRRLKGARIPAFPVLFCGTPGVRTAAPLAWWRQPPAIYSASAGTGP